MKENTHELPAFQLSQNIVRHHIVLPVCLFDRLIVCFRYQLTKTFFKTSNIFFLVTWSGERARCCVPIVKHFELQADQELHAFGTQSRRGAPHGDNSINKPHALPPQLALTAMLRVRCCMPPTHDCEQALNELQVDSTQSIADAPHICASLS